MSKPDSVPPGGWPGPVADQPDGRAVAAEQLREHFAQIPAMAIAPTLGMAYTAWVLWGAVPHHWLVAGVMAITALSGCRLLLYWRFVAAPWPPTSYTAWARLAVLASLLSGCLWGSAAPLLYQAASHGEYDTYLLVLLTLVPIIPVAALAAYLPAFYAYYFPCMAPFVVTLALQPGRAERLTAVLLVMMMLAMLTFARGYSASLTEAIRLRLALADKSAALESTVRQKTQLIAAASHDLRQPVHAMGLFLEALQERRGGLDEPIVLAHLQAGLRSLRGMLDNMLDIARVDAGIVSPRLAVVPVHEVVHRLADEYALLALDRGLVLRCRSMDAWARTDPMLLERILRNLLSNALKFTRRGGVVLAVRADGDQVRLQVIDTGIGISPENTARVFEPFAQLAHTDTDRNEGTGLGLGLTIVQHLSALLGHPLRMDSRPGHGTRFTLLLNRLPDLAGVSVAGAGLGRPAVGMPPSRVLMIDNDEIVAAGTAALLRLWGHWVVVCNSEDEALRRLADSTEPPALVLSDLQLGDTGSGLRAVERIRQQLGSAVPVLLVTGDTSAERLREAVDAGHLLLHKPVDPQRLRAAMAEAWLSGQGCRMPGLQPDAPQP